MTNISHLLVDLGLLGDLFQPVPKKDELMVSAARVNQLELDVLLPSPLAQRME